MAEFRAQPGVAVLLPGRGRQEVQGFHDKFVVATIENEVADLSDLAFDNRGVLAHGCGTLKHTSRLQLPRTGIQLHTNVRRDHRPENGDILWAVHAKKDEDKRIGLAARRDHAAEQKSQSAKDNSSHGMPHRQTHKEKMDEAICCGGAAMLRPYKEEGCCFLVAAGPREGVDERAGTRRVVPHLKRGVEIKDVAGGEAAAGAVYGEDRVAIDFVEVDVLQHGAAPVREVEEIHAGLVGVDAGLDGDAAHGLAAAEEQIQIVAVATATFLDDLRNGDA